MFILIKTFFKIFWKNVLFNENENENDNEMLQVSYD